MTEKLKITDLITRFIYYPSLTISIGTAYVSVRPDFNLPGTGICGSGSSTTTTASRQPVFQNDYGWSNAFGFKF